MTAFLGAVLSQSAWSQKQNPTPDPRLGASRLTPADELKVENIARQLDQQNWRGQLSQIPLQPAPEVVRLWSPEVLAGVRISAKVLADVAEMDSRDYSHRQAASARLSQSSVSAEEIFAVLVRGQLSDEQRERLLTVARDKVLSLPRGALGIQMVPSGSPAAGVDVTRLLPGMPAQKVLKVGDRIEQIDGKPIGNSNDLVEIIQSKLPGERVKLSIARPVRDERGKPRFDERGDPIEERMEVQVDLTSAADLDKFEGQDRSTTRSLVLERRLLALKMAEAHFAPSTMKVGTTSPLEQLSPETQFAPAIKPKVKPKVKPRVKPNVK